MEFAEGGSLYSGNVTQFTMQFTLSTTRNNTEIKARFFTVLMPGK